MQWCIINLSTTWRSLVILTPQLLYSKWKGAPASVLRRLERLYSQSGYFAEEKNPFPYHGQNLRSPRRHPTHYTTELFRLPYEHIMHSSIFSNICRATYWLWAPLLCKTILQSWFGHQQVSMTPQSELCHLRSSSSDSRTVTHIRYIHKHQITI